MRLALLCWVAITRLDPEVKADATASAKSVGRARAEATWSCGRDLDSQCYELGKDRVLAPDYGGPQCEEDDEGWATCSVSCWGDCSAKPAEGDE